MSDPQHETGPLASSWRVRPLLVLALALTVAAAHSVPAPAEVVPESLVQARRRQRLRQEFSDEQERRIGAIEDELAHLGRRHAWAGRYLASESLSLSVTVWIAPEAGFVARSCNCFGCSAVSFGKVVEDAHGDLQLVFEAPNGTQRRPWFPDGLETTCQSGVRQVVGFGRRFELEPLVDAAQRD